MGICVACFERDIAGAIGLHRAAVVQYIRPEIIGFVLGSLLLERYQDPAYQDVLATWDDSGQL